MTWRLAQSLITLRDQIDAMYPNRDKRTDGALSGYPGSISGHNPNSAGVVCAFDITTGDYPGGISVAQSQPLADSIRLELLAAPRGLYTYLIHHMDPPYVQTSGAYIAHGGPSSLWQWIPYTGDPHTSHIHVSVDWDIAAGEDASGVDPYDMTDPWHLGGVSTQSSTITTIQEDDMAQADIDEMKGNLQKLVKALVPGEGSTSDLGEVTLNLRKVVYGIGVLPALGTALVSIAQGVGDIKNKPASVPATVTVDVQELAAELKPLLPNADVAAELITAIRNLSFAAK